MQCHSLCVNALSQKILSPLVIFLYFLRLGDIGSPFLGTGKNKYLIFKNLYYFLFHKFIKKDWRYHTDTKEIIDNTQIY